MKDEEISKNVKLLFTLPKSTLLFISLFTFMILLITISLVEIFPLSHTCIFIIFLLLQILLTRKLGGMNVPYANLRRILAANVASFIPLVALPLPFLLLSSLNEKVLILSLAASNAILYIIYYGAIYNKKLTALLSSSFPFLLLFLGKLNYLYVILYVSMLLLITILLKFLDDIALSLINEKTTNIFKYFMSAWVSDFPFFLENVLESLSKKTIVKTYALYFKTKNKTKDLAVIIPYIHPGPFKSVGGYNLPYEIKCKLGEGRHIIVLHAPVNHDLDLPSYRQLVKYLNNLISLNPLTLKVTDLKVKKVEGKFYEYFFILLNHNKVIVILSPKIPSEDFPSSFLKRIEKISKEELKREIIVVDAHNNLGNVPSLEMIQEATESIQNFNFSIASRSNNIKVGYSHIDPWSAEDIGPGGADCLIINQNNSNFVLLIFDANNVKKGLSQKLRSDLLYGSEGKYSDILILTTDSHFNAATILNEKGYLSLGERTSYDMILKIARNLIKESERNISEAEIYLFEWKFYIKTLGENALTTLNRITKEALKTFKVIWMVLFLYFLVIFLLI